MRSRSPSPQAGPSQTVPKSSGKAKPISTTPRKTTLFDDLDAGVGPKRSVERGKALLDKLAASEDDESSLSSLSEDEFEDVPNAKRQKMDEGADDDDEDIEFEDVDTNPVPALSGPPPSGDLELTLTRDTRVSITNPFGTKKGPSKIERQIRMSTHQIHVQLLMFHNAIRNAWCCDQELQDILVKQLPPRIKEQIGKWRDNSGVAKKSDDTPKGKEKGKAKDTKGKKADRKNRDWNENAETLGDGNTVAREQRLISLLKALQKDWKYRFRITAPGLRKLGYMSLQALDAESKSFREDEHNPERHGERIRDIGEFREHAKAMEGSRDVGSQLFTALLRGLGLEVRMVANLQPVGFGWSQVEEAFEENIRKPEKSREKKLPTKLDPVSTDEDGSSGEDSAPRSTLSGKEKEPARKKSLRSLNQSPGKALGDVFREELDSKKHR